MSDTFRIGLAVVMIAFALSGGGGTVGNPDKEFLRGMLAGMADTVQEHPESFNTMYGFQAYRDRVIAKAKQDRGSVQGSEKLGQILGDQLNAMPFDLGNVERSKLVQILRDGADKL